MKARLELLLAQIDEQIGAIERQQRMEAEVLNLQHWRRLTPMQILDGVDSEDLPVEVNVFEFRLGDGSYPLVPLLAAKAQVLHALAMIQVTENT